NDRENVPLHFSPGPDFRPKNPIFSIGASPKTPLHCSSWVTEPPTTEPPTAGSPDAPAPSSDRPHVRADIDVFRKDIEGRTAPGPQSDRECVALVKKAIPEIGNTAEWRAGTSIKGPGDPPLEKGTAIATFGKDGTYGTAQGKHAALYLRDEERNGEKGIVVLDQWAERNADPATGQRRRLPKSASERFIPYAGHGGINDAFSYSVIRRGGTR
ncbi:MAG: BPSL0067 family protein, partial [Magnetospirillum sp. WYHS-4]